MLDMVVSIKQRNMCDDDIEIKMIISKLPICKDEVCDNLGVDCVNSGNYTIEFIDDYCGLELDYMETVEEVNSFYGKLKELYEKYPDFVKLTAENTFRFVNGTVPSSYVFKEMDNISVLSYCNNYKDIDKQFDYDWMNYYLYAFGGNRAFMLRK